jgi:tetratricopeptide (TPR) repeat protein
MSELAYIESYFKGELPTEELKKFEQRISDNPAFAEEVAFYCSSMHLVKNQLADEKKKQFSRIYEESKILKNQTKPALVKRLWPYIAAAAIVAGLIFSFYMFSKPPSPQQLADKYIRQNFGKELPVKMSGKEDSLEAAIRFYNENILNEKKLPEALLLFEKIIQADNTAGKPKKMAGIVSLRIGEYDKAIEYFTQLENLQLYSNPGKLYHALALIKRNRPGDKEMAKQLLKQVMDLNTDEKETVRKLWKSL